jgi:hypothetical protein
MTEKAKKSEISADVVLKASWKQSSSRACTTWPRERTVPCMYMYVHVHVMLVSWHKRIDPSLTPDPQFSTTFTAGRRELD